MLCGGRLSTATFTHVCVGPSFSFRGGRIWNILDNSNDRNIALYSHVFVLSWALTGRMNQRKVLSVQIAGELKKQEKKQSLMVGIGSLLHA